MQNQNAISKRVLWLLLMSRGYRAPSHLLLCFSDCTRHGHFYVPETGSIDVTNNKIKQRRGRSMLTVPGTDICGASIDQCMCKKWIIAHDAAHCCGENILIYFPKLVIASLKINGKCSLEFLGEFLRQHWSTAWHRSSCR